MTPIHGLTEVRRLPRVGKIRLGIKKESKKQPGVYYPVAMPFFVCPPEVKAIYGDEPTSLDVIIPVEDDELWSSQYYRQYSRTRGLICKGDGVTCRRMVDTETGDVARRDTKIVKWEEGKSCAGRDCPDYQKGACQEVMNLQVILPRVPGLGVWQIDTGSINSIRNINDCATMIRAVCDRVSWIPLTLTLEPTEVVNPDDGKKKTVYCMHLRQVKGLQELLDMSNKPRATLLISAPVDDEEPMDKIINIKSPEHSEAFEGMVEDKIEELWPEDKPANAPDASQDKQGEVKERKAVGSTSSPPVEVVKERGIMANWDVFLASVKKVRWENGIRDFILREFDASSEGDLKELAGQLTLEQQDRLGAEVKAKLAEYKKEKLAEYQKEK